MSSLEDQLKRERDRAQIIVSSIGEGVVVIDPNHRITQINSAAANLLETTQQEALNQLWSDVTKTFRDNQEISLTDRTFSRVLQTGETVVVTGSDNCYYQTKSGRKFPIAATTSALAQDNQIIGAVKIFRDITAEKEASRIIEQIVADRTRQLGWEKARLTTSINNLPNGFILTDPENNIIMVNHSALNILDLPHSTHTLSQIADRLKPFFDLTSAHQTCLKDETTLTVPEISLDAKFIRLFISPIYVSDDTASNYVGSAFLITNITEQKVLERSKDEFFSIASHELRTPLTAIRGNTSMILDYYSAQLTDPDLHHMIDDVHESSVRLIEIVNDFLNVSRLEQSRIEFKKAEFDMGILAKEVIDELGATTPPPPVPLLLTLPEASLPKVLADRDRTKQVLFNLLGNALKFTTAGKVEVSFAPQNTLLEVLITDTGRGIPPAQQGILFHKFQQAGESLFTRDTTKGTGLGLYISKLLIEGMGGKIRLVKSEPDVGSVFSFTLPLVPSP
jgi:PAS domain S-box-containing protein